jgi:hypothetical protein
MSETQLKPMRLNEAQSNESEVGIETLALEFKGQWRLIIILICLMIVIAF